MFVSKTEGKFMKKLVTVILTLSFTTLAFAQLDCNLRMANVKTEVEGFFKMRVEEKAFMDEYVIRLSRNDFAKDVENEYAEKLEKLQQKYVDKKLTDRQFYDTFTSILEKSGKVFSESFAKSAFNMDWQVPGRSARRFMPMVIPTGNYLDGLVATTLFYTGVYIDGNDVFYNANSGNYAIFAASVNGARGLKEFTSIEALIFAAHIDIKKYCSEYYELKQEEVRNISIETASNKQENMFKGVYSLVAKEKPKDNEDIKLYMKPSPSN